MTLFSQPGDTSDGLTSQQVNMAIILWGTYAAFYLGRLNLSPALPEIADSLKIGLGEVGVLMLALLWRFKGPHAQAETDAEYENTQHSE